MKRKRISCLGVCPTAKIFHMHMQINMKHCLSQGFGIQAIQLESFLKFLSTLGETCYACSRWRTKDQRH